MAIEIRSIDHDTGDHEVLGRIDDGGKITEGRGALREVGVVGYLDLVDDPGELLDVVDGPHTLAVEVEPRSDPDGEAAEKAVSLLDRLFDAAGF